MHDVSVKNSDRDRTVGGIQDGNSTGSGTQMTLQEALQRGEQYLCDCGIEDASIDAWLLLEFVTGIRRAMFLAERRSRMKADHQQQYFLLIKERGKHIPLQHLTGEQEFMGLSFRVNEHVLIPRQDTEVLVEEALKRVKPGMHVLDLCTGSGCIAVSIAKLAPQTDSWKGLQQCRAGKSSILPGSALHTDVPDSTLKMDVSDRILQVDASDISEEALAVAGENIKRLEAPVHLIHSDLFEQITGQYDMIVSNPPYIRTAVIEELAEEVRRHEPYRALDGKEDGLYFYRRIVEECKKYLVSGGYLLFEIGYDQGMEVSKLMLEHGFEEVQVYKDLPGLDRVVAGKRIQK